MKADSAAVFAAAAVPIAEYVDFALSAPIDGAVVAELGLVLVVFDAGAAVLAVLWSAGRLSWTIRSTMALATPSASCLRSRNFGSVDRLAGVPVPFSLLA